MAVEKTKYTAVEFWEFVNLPENADKHFERIDGEIIEVMPSSIKSSVIANLIAHFITLFVLTHKLGFVSGADGGYDVEDENTFAPDVAFISKARQSTLPDTGFNRIPPDLVVEVVSPSDLKDPKRRIQRKLEKYLAAGIPLIWYVYLERQEVEVYELGKSMRVVGIDDVLDGGAVLPGFTLALKDVFDS